MIKSVKGLLLNWHGPGFRSSQWPLLLSVQPRASFLTSLSISFHICKIRMLDLKYIMKIKLKNVGEPLTELGPHLAAGAPLTAQLCVYSLMLGLCPRYLHLAITSLPPISWPNSYLSFKILFWIPLFQEAFHTPPSPSPSQAGKVLLHNKL